MEIEVAEKLVTEHLNTKYPGLRGEFILARESAIKKSYGWVIFFVSRRFVETGDLMYAFGGNAPLIVEAATGTVHELSAAYQPEEAIRRFEQEHALG